MHGPIVEYARGRIAYGILFILSLFYEYSNLEYVHIHIIYRVNQAEYGIRIRVAAWVNPSTTHLEAARDERDRCAKCQETCGSGDLLSVELQTSPLMSADWRR